ncbi:hypothetical protein F5887DRAFT_1158529 [Amanita rubescens]|nr:hypothetical protein F5887DRAFT_1158529 [Amanita rubescens]
MHAMDSNLHVSVRTPAQAFLHPAAFVRNHLATHSLDPSLPPLQGNSLPEHFHRIGLATASPYRDAETMPKEGHPYPVIAIAASSNACVPRGTSERRREKPKRCRGEAVEAMVDLIAHVKEKEEQARERGEAETVESLTSARMDMEDSLQVPYQFEMDWDGNENENDGNDDGNRTWESLTSANSLVDVARLHCNVELEQDKEIEGCVTLRYRNLTNLNLNMTRCKYRKIRRSSVLSLPLSPTAQDGV